MNYRNVYRVLSIKDAFSVLWEIYNGCMTEEYKTFENIRESLKMNKNTLRRITNRLSRSGLIQSSKSTSYHDKRKRVFVIIDSELFKKISELTEYMTR